MKPTRGKYLCEIISAVKQLPSGLFIADTVKEVPCKAKVLIAGDNGRDDKGKEIEQSAKENDVIHFKRVWHREMPKEKSLIFIKEDEIVAIERTS